MKEKKRSEYFKCCWRHSAGERHK